MPPAADMSAADKSGAPGVSQSLGQPGSAFAKYVPFQLDHLHPAITPQQQLPPAAATLTIQQLLNNPAFYAAAAAAGGFDDVVKLLADQLQPGNKMPQPSVLNPAQEVSGHRTMPPQPNFLSLQQHLAAHEAREQLLLAAQQQQLSQPPLRLNQEPLSLLTGQLDIGTKAAPLGFTGLTGSAGNGLTGPAVAGLLGPAVAGVAGALGLNGSALAALTALTGLGAGALAPSAAALMNLAGSSLPQQQARAPATANGSSCGDKDSGAVHSQLQPAYGSGSSQGTQSQQQLLDEQLQQQQQQQQLQTDKEGTGCTDGLTKPDSGTCNVEQQQGQQQQHRQQQEDRRDCGSGNQSGSGSGSGSGTPECRNTNAEGAEFAQHKSPAAKDSSKLKRKAQPSTSDVSDGIDDLEGCSGGGSKASKKQRLIWTPELHARFLNAVNHLGVRNAVPKTILQLMNVQGMTRENVASHLQKYRLYLKRLAGLPANAPLSADTLQQVQGVQHMMQQQVQAGLQQQSLLQMAAAGQGMQGAQLGNALTNGMTNGMANGMANGMMTSAPVGNAYHELLLHFANVAANNAVVAAQAASSVQPNALNPLHMPPLVNMINPQLPPAMFPMPMGGYGGISPSSMLTPSQLTLLGSQPLLAAGNKYLGGFLPDGDMYRAQ